MALSLPPMRPREGIYMVSKQHFMENMEWLKSFKGCNQTGSVVMEFASEKHHRSYTFGTWFDIEHLLYKPHGTSKDLQCGFQDAGWWIYVCKDCAKEIGLQW